LTAVVPTPPLARRQHGATKPEALPGEALGALRARPLAEHAGSTERITSERVALRSLRSHF